MKKREKIIIVLMMVCLIGAFVAAIKESALFFSVGFILFLIGVILITKRRPK